MMTRCMKLGHLPRNECPRLSLASILPKAPLAYLLLRRRSNITTKAVTKPNSSAIKLVVKIWKTTVRCISVACARSVNEPITIIPNAANGTTSALTSPLPNRFISTSSETSARTRNCTGVEKASRKAASISSSSRECCPAYRVFKATACAILEGSITREPKNLKMEKGALRGPEASLEGRSTPISPAFAALFSNLKISASSLALGLNSMLTQLVVCLTPVGEGTTSVTRVENSTLNLRWKFQSGETTLMTLLMDVFSMQHKRKSSYVSRLPSTWKYFSSAHSTSFLTRFSISDHLSTTFASIPSPSTKEKLPKSFLRTWNDQRRQSTFEKIETPSSALPVIPQLPSSRFMPSSMHSDRLSES
mmetsp:Transcript_5757/g.20955  ORF Transcript_5757/g.20955 Transcript_5757/m.20955 type:complete len:362 (+) Transcript_5757:379-1464(+)